ncbi:MAG: hypothetical protein MR935_00420 [Agathobaculum sp.]|uniref:hypothetical protein n=1 Tax=Agathobaculum sp. TaxID=2048138 RepID=UPI0025C02DF9|nr:hypothetical protein [Agathobaculum sp.]MCI7124656.1 hypothetical protein [Agathobaculum sp.]MDY3712259.1 hypothetical protein [Agathobaculum sp.]
MNQFDYLYDAIVKKYPALKIADNTTAFQFMSTPTVADWVTGTDEKAYNIADVVPAQLGGFYKPGSARVSVSYQSLIESLMTALGDNNPQYRQLQDKMTTQLNLLQVALNDAKGAYGMYRTEQLALELTPTDFNTWLTQDITAAPYQKKHENVRSEYERYSKEAEELYKGMGAALSDAREQLGKDQMLIAADVTGGKYVPGTTIGGNLSADIDRWQQVPDQFDFDVIIENDDREITPWHTVSTTEAKQSRHKTEVINETQVSRIITDKHYQLRVKAVGLRAYPITRGSWYNDLFVHPNVQLPQGRQLNTDSFFGESGGLHMIPTSILVIYRPQIELTISKTCYQDIFSDMANIKADWLNLFNMRFDLQASLKLGQEIGEETVMQTFVSPCNAPAQILGVSSVVRYSGFQGW